MVFFVFSSVGLVLQFMDWRGSMGSLMLGNDECDMTKKIQPFSPIDHKMETSIYRLVLTQPNGPLT